MIDWYRLEGRKPVPCTVMEAALLLERADRRRVGLDERNGVQVSTVFLALDHARGGRPLLFETMIFGGQFDQLQWRYATWEEAEAGHKRACALAFAPRILRAWWWFKRRVLQISGPEELGP